MQAPAGETGIDPDIRPKRDFFAAAGQNPGPNVAFSPVYQKPPADITMRGAFE
jgi:hypothetical protein